MNFCWNDYINLAEKLIKYSKDNKEIVEAFLRTSISRSYYGIYCSAKKYLISVYGNSVLQKDYNSDVRDEDNKNKITEHMIIQNIYINSDEDLKKEIGEHLKNLRINRNKSDYYEDYNININNTILLNISAKKAMTCLKKLGFSD